MPLALYHISIVLFCLFGFVPSVLIPPFPNTFLLMYPYVFVPLLSLWPFAPFSNLFVASVWFCLCVAFHMISFSLALLFRFARVTHCLFASSLLFPFALVSLCYCATWPLCIFARVAQYPFSALLLRRCASVSSASFPLCPFNFCPSDLVPFS